MITHRASQFLAQQCVAELGTKSVKFHADGTAAPHFGLTTVCALKENESLYAVICSIQNSLSTDPDLAPHYTLLPPSSFHMTVFDIISHKKFEEVTPQSPILRAVSGASSPQCLRRIIIVV